MRRRVPLALAILLLAAAPVPASAATILLESSLDCAQANAGVGTCQQGGSGTGSAAISFDDVTNELSWNITWSGLSAPATAAHFHGPALPSQNADITVGIGTTTPAVGAATLTPAQAAELLDELWYINVHTSNFIGGEIRGQVTIVPEPGTLALLGGALACLGAVRRQRRP